MIDTKKLREVASECDNRDLVYLSKTQVLEVLERIDALEAENRGLRDALREISEWSDDPESVSIANEALDHGIKKDGG